MVANGIYGNACNAKLWVSDRVEGACKGEGKGRLPTKVRQEGAVSTAPMYCAMWWHTSTRMQLITSPRWLYIPLNHNDLFMNLRFANTIQNLLAVPSSAWYTFDRTRLPISSLACLR